MRFDNVELLEEKKLLKNTDWYLRKNYNNIIKIAIKKKKKNYSESADLETISVKITNE